MVFIPCKQGKLTINHFIKVKALLLFGFKVYFASQM
jgi:hypothetical protein